MNRYGKIERIVGKNNQVNHTKRLREESFELGYKDGLNGESRTKLNNILSCEYIDGYSYGERDRKDALCGVRFKYLPESNGEEYTKGYNAGRMYEMRQYSPVSDDIYNSERKVI